MLIFDASAIAAWFAGAPAPMDLWQIADSGGTRIAVPTLAIVEAAQAAGISEPAWDLFLLNAGVVVLPLDQAAAVEIGTWGGTLDARHALWESRRLRATIVTRTPELYADGAPLLIV